MKVCTSGNLDLSREYQNKLFGHLFYPWWNCPLIIPFQVCITDILQEEGQKTASELQSKYGQERVTFIHCDVTKESELKGNQCSVT